MQHASVWSITSTTSMTMSRPIANTDIESMIYVISSVSFTHNNDDDDDEALQRGTAKEAMTSNERPRYQHARRSLVHVPKQASATASQTG